MPRIIDFVRNKNKADNGSDSDGGSDSNKDNDNGATNLTIEDKALDVDMDPDKQRYDKSLEVEKLFKQFAIAFILQLHSHIFSLHIQTLWFCEQCKLEFTNTSLPVFSGIFMFNCQFAGFDFVSGISVSYHFCNHFFNFV